MFYFFFFRYLTLFNSCISLKGFCHDARVAKILEDPDCKQNPQVTFPQILQESSLAVKNYLEAAYWYPPDDELHVGKCYWDRQGMVLRHSSVIDIYIYSGAQMCYYKRVDDCPYGKVDAGYHEAASSCDATSL